MLMFVALVVTGCTKDDGLKPDCDINAGPCIKSPSEGLTLELMVTPRPVRAMRELEFEVKVSGGPEPAGDGAVVLDFTMPGMYMGVNRYELKPEGEGVYRAEGVLPRCPRGGRLWRAEVILPRGGRDTVRADFLFEVD